jgi:hypothetical protein
MGHQPPKQGFCSNVQMVAGENNTCSRDAAKAGGRALTFTMTTMKPVPAIWMSLRVAASSLRTCHEQQA